VDFVHVGTVVNFDFPRSLRSYTHRAGRTARAGRSGVVLSFVEPGERDALERILATQAEARGGAGLEASPGDLQPLPFNAADLDAFRYRGDDVIRRCTAAAVRDARLAEIRRELLNSARLKAHFEDNPRELALLRHDGALKPKRVQSHLASVPDYLLPEYLQGQSLEGAGGEIGGGAGAQHGAGATRGRNRRSRGNDKRSSGGGGGAAASNAGGAGVGARRGSAMDSRAQHKALQRGVHQSSRANSSGAGSSSASGADPLRSFRAAPQSASAAAHAAAGRLDAAARSSAKARAAF
jgi:ATP-dependent RNA helicase DDX56/DBP9